MTIKAVIFCGGRGTRIRDVADDIPKPLLSVGDRPILWHIMKTYSHYGINDFVLCLGYKGWLIKEFFLNYRYFTSDLTLSLDNKTPIQVHSEPTEANWRITLAETGIDTQTGGRLWRVRPYLEDSPLFCVTYGDGVADINMDDLLAFHRSHGCIGTVTGVHPQGRFGVLSIDPSADVPMVSAFNEKPQSLEGFINGGFFVFDHRLWDYLSADPSLIFEQQPLTALAAAGQLAVYEHNGFWQPMDTYREWSLLNDLWERGAAPWKR